MKLVVLVAALAVVSASVVKDDVFGVVFGKENLETSDVKVKELCLLKLLNHVLQPTMYEDVREVAREWSIEENHDKYLKIEVVREFLDMVKRGMLPRGEVFVHTNDKQLVQAIKVFRLLYFAKDFDVFIRTACWLRERINPGMFVYALTACVFHRPDCRGISLPAPYEIYPYFFVDSFVINKAFQLKMTKAAFDPVISDYYGIKVTDKNIVTIDWRKGVRHSLNKEDRTRYFTEDIDLNTYMYYLHMNFPFWMSDEVYGLHKERRGEIMMYAYQQLLARFRLERLTKNMCDIKPLMLNEPLKTGYWPKLRLHNGEEMPMRSNNVRFLTQENIREKLLAEDLETIIREAILKGKIELRDGTLINLKKPEDVEYLARLVLGGMGSQFFFQDDAKVLNLVTLFKRMLTYDLYNVNKFTYVPTALDMYSTCLRDPAFFKILKRINNYFILFKKTLKPYTYEELSFPGVKVEEVTTDKLVTFMDEYDVDITNAVYLDQAEIKKQRPDMIFLARMHRMNHHPFKVNIEVDSEKAVDAVVRVFLGPKFDCMGRLMSFNDARHDMVELDSFVYKLETGKNMIVRNSLEMHGVIADRPMTRRVWDKALDSTINVGDRIVENWWYKSRVGFPHRLLLPMGTRGGVTLQLFVSVTPVRTGLVLPTIDMTTMKERRACYWSVCLDTLPLGFPMDRELVHFPGPLTNMKHVDVTIFRKDMSIANNVKDVNTSDMLLKRDDLTYLDSDMLVSRSYKETMVMGSDNMTRL